jgi:hypothetical protein
MFLAATKAGGQAVAFPDVCKVPAPPGPPIPTPFPNTAVIAQAQGVAKKVKLAGAAAVTVAAFVPRTMGDEAGVGGGMTSGTNMDRASFKVGVVKVLIEGNQLVVQLKTTGHNGTNANMPAGMVAAPGQTKVFANG